MTVRIHFNFRLMWLVMTIACICAVGYQIYERVSFFGSWPVNVNVEINYNKTLTFPAVTICNQNSFRATKAAELGLYDLIEDVFSKSAVSPVEVIRRNNASNITIADLFVNLGHDKHDLFVSCRWKNTDCGPEDFISVLTDHGLCYTFSPNSSEMAISAPGIDSGLQLMLNIEQYEYMNGPHDSAGVKILLHDREQTPLVASLGQAVSTGFSAFAGMNLLTIKYQPPPYGDCGSKPLNHTTFYTAEECFLDCMTAILTEKCGCRDMHMNTNGSDGPAVCNLLQYFSCMKDAKDEFYGMFEQHCKCPVSCEVTLFDPTFSDGSLSNHAVDSLLTSNLSTSLYRKLLEASEVKARMDKRKQGELRNLLVPLNETNAVFTSKIYFAEAYYNMKRGQLRSAVERFGFIYEFLVWLRNYQLYVFNTGLFQGKDTVANYFSESTDEFLYIWHKRLTCLLNMSDTKDFNREVIYNDTVEELQFRKYLIKRAQDDITSLFYSFVEGVIVNDIFFPELNQSIANIFVPNVEMEEALRYCNNSFGGPLFDTLKYCKEEIINLYSNVSVVVDQLIDLTESAFRNPDDILHPISNKIISQYVNATLKTQTCRNILNDMLFQRPIFTLKTKNENTNALKEKFYELSNKTILQISELIDEIVVTTKRYMGLFKTFIDMANESVESKQHSIVYIFSVLYSDDFYFVIHRLKDLSSEVERRADALHDSMLDLLNTATNLSELPSHEFVDTYLETYNAMFFKNTGDGYESIWISRRRLEHAIHEYIDPRRIFWNYGHKFIDAVDDLKMYLDNFNKSVSINNIFLRENFLKLNVFYRQLSYEHIQQQKGYDIFALICDIGGSMGLFIGASMLTVVEVIDILLRQTPVFGRKTKCKDNSSQTSDK